MAKVTFAAITDIHYGPDTGAKYGSKAPGLLDVFAKAAMAYEPDFIVDMGDDITAFNHDDAIKNLQSVKDVFNRMAAPMYNVIGNHNIIYLTREENEQIMGNPGNSYSRDINGYHFVFWNPPIDTTGKGLNMSEEEMDWLRNDLAATDKPTVLFSHVPLDNTAKDNKSGRAASKSDKLYFFYPEGAKVRKIMEDSGKVIMCMAGHRHTNRYREINGIHYITQQSLVQAHEKHYRKPHRAWSVVDLDDDKITIRLKGRAPMRLQGSITKKFSLVPRTSPLYTPQQVMPESEPEAAADLSVMDDVPETNPDTAVPPASNEQPPAITGTEAKADAGLPEIVEIPPPDKLPGAGGQNPPPTPL